jgi:hypothetical protein
VRLPVVSTAITTAVYDALTCRYRQAVSLQHDQVVIDGGEPPFPQAELDTLGLLADQVESEYRALLLHLMNDDGWAVVATIREQAVRSLLSDLMYGLLSLGFTVEIPGVDR